LIYCVGRKAHPRAVAGCANGGRMRSSVKFVGSDNIVLEKFTEIALT
jgi:hypothetical protein